ncbi:MAG: hypothetical protein WCT49_02385 [Candidatus Paceibacterota bacterium]|nr:hypothetical protein [Candidatus Paceibacterota bacterium]
MKDKIIVAVLVLFGFLLVTGAVSHNIVMVLFAAIGLVVTFLIGLWMVYKE